MTVLLTGATGYVGGRLLGVLERGGAGGLKFEVTDVRRHAPV